MVDIKSTDKSFILNTDKSEEFLTVLERRDKCGRPPLPRGKGTKTVYGIFEVPKLRRNDSAVSYSPNRSPRRKRREIIGDKYKEYEFKPLEGFRPPLPDIAPMKHIEYRPSKIEMCVLCGSVGILVVTLFILIIYNALLIF